MVKQYSDRHRRLIREEYIKLPSDLATVLVDGHGDKLKSSSVERFFDFFAAVIAAIAKYDKDITLAVLYDELARNGVLSRENESTEVYQLIFIGTPFKAVVLQVVSKPTLGLLKAS